MSNANLLAQPPDYLQAYSLKCEPFANTLDGRFFYAGTALMQRLDLLIHLTQFGDSVVLVSGPDGSGKTTLLSRFAAQANKQWRLCPINADEFEQFPRLMADALRTDDANDELEMLSRWASKTDNSQLLVILIDRAEALAGPAVDLLCKLLACPVRERLRLILFGTPAAQKALKNTLDSRNLPGSSQLLEVPRLSEEETSSYLLYRLAVAGYSGESPFTATEVRGICKAAEGRPGAINLLAHDTLVERQARKSSKRVSATSGKPKLGTAAWAPLTLVIVALATYLGWQRLQPTPEPGAPTAGPGAETQPIPLAIPDPVLEPQPEPVAVPPPAVASNAIAPATQPVAKTAARAEPGAVSLPLPDLVTPPVDAGKKIEVEASGPVIARIPASPAPQATQPLAAPGTISAPESPAKPPIKAVAVTADTAPAARTDDTKPAIVEKTVPAPESGTQGPHREAWLLAQQGELYSLQLLGSRSQKSVIDYVNRYQLDLSRTAYYRGNYRGGEWYVLMYGVYPDRQAALEARASLPAVIRKGKPWPRDLESVHKAINDARR